MTSRRFNLLTFAAVALAALVLPSAASAQGSIWDRIRDRAEQKRHRDEDYRRNRRDDDYRRGRGGRINDYERRRLRDTARRIHDRSKDLQRNLDRLLDRSRYDDSRREDNINQAAQRFRDTASRFKDAAGDSNDLYRSEDEARQLLNEASRLDRMLSRVRMDSRTSNDWHQIRNDLRTVADIYGLRFNSGGGYYGGNDRRGRRDNRYPY